MTGILGESWAMGSLEHAVETLRAAAPQLQILLLNDVPNCDLDPAHKCSTGSLQGDDDDWFRILDTLGLNKCGFRSALLLFSIFRVKMMPMQARVKPRKENSQKCAGPSHSTWGVWDLFDGGSGDTNSYGDAKNDGSGLTAKGKLHAARAELLHNVVAGAVV